MAEGAHSERLSLGDPNSFSRPEDCVITDLSLDIEVDFGRKVVKGKGTYTCKRVSVGADVLILDTDRLTISRVYCKDSSTDLQFTLADPVDKFGSKLQIILLSTFSSEFEICIDFENSPTSEGLQWLEKEQTAGKRHPYMFSQFESIMARTVLPCQDTPSVKHPYRAKVTVNKALTVLMSAVPQGSAAASDDKVTYEFFQKIPIPSYLIAIAVGDLVSRKIGERSKVWTEPEMLDAAAYEFAETDTMLKTAEDLCGPYIWGVYDLLVLPPSFPFGGMENPCLTFVTPTLLAGDRSATSVIAHEISHSWTGNLVTNKNWEHFWLNEGHTVFVERKIVGRMYGEQHRQFAMIGGWTALYEAVKDFGETHGFTHLVPDLTGSHPDDAFSRVPYDKGAALLFYIESQVGGADAMEGWLKAYVQKFKGQAITTDEWKDFLYSYFATQHDALNKIDWQNWLYSPGMPATKPVYDQTLFTACETLANHWLAGTDLPQDSAVFDGFSTNQKVAFLSTLLIKDPMPVDRVLQMGALYRLPGVNNAEIKTRWLQLCLRAGSDSQLDATLKFVTDVGRMKFLRPIYKDLYKLDSVRQQAINTFIANRPQMHRITAKMVAEDLHLNE
ncbi:leukotriene A-4 hydrolase-like isoform X1 [Watersipora subatra]|uniref:leukotriene A-4 hydrolase-like isoform X1 n=1 Tax=Watersipora subatra TaxID=2589382 RepID=UPI00355BB9E6